MFTGIVTAIGEVSALSQIESEWRLVIKTGQLDMSDVALGDSIAVSGCCLTVVSFDSNQFAADVSQESMRCTTLGSLQVGSKVNLEKAMQVGDRFGGHIVSGHVDGVGELIASEPEGKSIRLDFSVPENLARYIAGKGSICIDGTSLTVNSVKQNQFSINVIPHTQEETIIGTYKPGQKVNLEVDLVARYLERLLGTDVASGEGGISTDFLQRHGFLKK